MKLKQKLLLILLFLLPTACMSSRQLPQDHYYRLPQRQQNALSAPLFKGVLAVAQPKSEGILNERTMLFVEANRPLEIQRSHYHLWQQAPARLIQHDLVDYLHQSKVANEVIYFEDGPDRAEVMLESRLLTFEEELDGADSEVKIRITFTLRKSESKAVVWHKTYQGSKASRSKQPQEATQAYGKLLSKIYTELLSDLQGQVRK